MSAAAERVEGTLARVPLPAANGIPDPAGVWEDLLTLVVDPDSPRVLDRERKRRMLSFLLERSGLDEASFWKLQRGQRGRLFLSRYSRVSREIARLEITSFDLDKLLKERYRQEPLTLGSAWHYCFWRSYFSHAAITHPANDGLREEFSTAWDIVRKHPAVLFATASGQTQQAIHGLRIDMPMIVGPLPYSGGAMIERAYLDAIAHAGAGHDVHTGTLVVIEAERYLEHLEVLAGSEADIMLRLSRELQPWLDGEGERFEALRTGLGKARIVELEWSEDLAASIERVLAVNPALLISVYLRYGGADFWVALEAAARQAGVAAIHVHAGPEKSYRLTPRLDAFLKARLVRARVQLITAGGDSDTQASAATVYESVLLGANGGSMSHVAGIAICPELIDVYHGADADIALAHLRVQNREALRDLAVNTLTCWQHSILDFLSCMGIDDIQKTSGNTMAITMTEDWVREVDRLATPEFGARNAELNAARIAAEPPPADVRARFKVSRLLGEIAPDLPLVQAAKILAHENANYHLENSNRNLSADFLEVIYRMAAGQLPREGDFFIEGDMGPLSLDRVGLKLSRKSLAWSLDRFRRDPAALDYISLAVPRGFLRPGAAPSFAEVRLLPALDEGSEGEGATEPAALVRFAADAEGGFDLSLSASPALERALATGGPLWLATRDVDGKAARVALLAHDHGAHGLSIVRASRDGGTVLRRTARPGSGAAAVGASAGNGAGSGTDAYQLVGFGFREPIWHGPVNHSSISLGAAS
ncbi:MAG: hypothetical protein ABIS67_02010, partial [Candidatus Eisenbacteria bacterium]